MFGATPTYVKYFTSSGTTGGSNLGVIFPHGIKPSLARIALCGRSIFDSKTIADNHRFALDYFNTQVHGLRAEQIRRICEIIAEVAKGGVVVKRVSDKHNNEDTTQKDVSLSTVSRDGINNICDYINNDKRLYNALIDAGFSESVANNITVVEQQTWSNNRIRLYYKDVDTSSIPDFGSWRSGDPLWVSDETNNKFLQMEDYSINPEDGFTIVVTAPENSAWMTLYNGSGRTLDDCLVESASFDIENDTNFTSHRVTLLSADDMKTDGDSSGIRNFIGVRVEWKENVVVDADTHNMYIDKFRNNKVKCAVVLKMKNGLHYTLLLTLNQIGGQTNYFIDFD